MLCSRTTIQLKSQNRGQRRLQTKKTKIVQQFYDHKTTSPEFVISNVCTMLLIPTHSYGRIASCDKSKNSFKRHIVTWWLLSAHYTWSEWPWNLIPFPRVAVSTDVSLEWCHSVTTRRLLTCCPAAASINCREWAEDIRTCHALFVQNVNHGSSCNSYFPRTLK